MGRTHTVSGEVARCAGGPTGAVMMRGAFDGAIATAVMTGAMLLARRWGLLARSKRLPPTDITSRTAARLGINLNHSGRLAATTLMHTGFGASLGALFAVIRKTKRLRSMPPTSMGIAFAMAVWAVSYAGWIPAVGLLPRPDRDRSGRPATTVLAHVIFGGVLGGLQARRTA